ncbi:MAG: sulfite exporter TauE/SafE family protein [Alphaproteobacteria bacterium]
MAVESVLLLLAAYFCTSAFSAALGMGGGMMITAVLATMLPIHAVIPVQSAMLFFNTGYRLWLYRRHAVWGVAWPFLVGLAVGSTLGAVVYTQLPVAWLELAVGLAMLLTTWWPKRQHPSALFQAPAVRVGVGAVHGFLSSVLGIGGLLQAIVARAGLARQAFIGTFSLLMWGSNIFRGIGLWWGGASITPYILLILCAIPIGMLGAHAGKRFLDGLNERYFRLLLKSFMTITGALMLWRAATTWGLSSF